MSFLDKIVDVATGGLAKQVMDTVKAYFPPDMNAQQKADLQVSLERIAMEREKNTNDAIRDSEEALNERIKMYEGTAQDVLAVPILGPIMVFLRGAQRICFGYGTIYLDFQVFSGGWKLEAGTQESCFWIVNFLVLGFLFGERAIKNVGPLIAQILSARKS